jgi:photosystem II stability/assembly factor-like uncharacterized protein
MTSSAVKSVVYGIGEAKWNFVGLERTVDGYIALTNVEMLVSSHDGGATFVGKETSQHDAVKALAMRSSSTGTTRVSEGVVAITPDAAPGAGTVYEAVWAPQGSRPIPENPEPGDCTFGPSGALPQTKARVYVSADRGFIAYVALDGTNQPTACISTNGGSSFKAHALSAPEHSEIPSGIVFANQMTAIAWGRNTSAGAYINRTTNGGETWTQVPIPAPIASHDLDLPGGFFAPDGQHGWLVGVDHDAPNPGVLLATTDGGETWSSVPGVGAAVDALHGRSLYSGFAIDATHIWLGGDAGLLIHN